MALIADILLVAAALGAGLYCHVLARRLSRFNNLETGMGGAVAVLSAQVDDLAHTLRDAQTAAGSESRSLLALTERAEAVAKRLELLVASMHDLPEPQGAAARQTPPEPPDSGVRKTADEGGRAPVFRRHADPDDRSAA